MAEGLGLTFKSLLAARDFADAVRVSSAPPCPLGFSALLHVAGPTAFVAVLESRPPSLRVKVFSFLF